MISEIKYFVTVISYFYYSHFYKKMIHIESVYCIHILAFN
jgi:hypothetical protein